jgi:hypothetical protein
VNNWFAFAIMLMVVCFIYPPIMGLLFGAGFIIGLRFIIVKIIEFVSS